MGKINNIIKKLTEAPEDNLPKVNKNNKFKVGDTAINNDTKSTVTAIDKETGRISWGIQKLPNLEELFDTSTELTQVAKDVYIKTKSDKKLRLIYDDARLLRNQIRTHIRNEYPEEYRRITMNMNEGELDEMSTTGGGNASFTPGTGMTYATPYAFKRPKKKQKSIPENKSLKTTEEYAGKKSTKSTKDYLNQNSKDTKSLKENLDLSSYGYSLVPKNKAGNYVQKGSGLDVKQLFEDQKDFQLKRVAAFDVIEQELNDIYKMLSNAKNETSEYYNDNPSSYTVIKPTDLVLDYIKDIKNLLKGE
jgi:hypothetical protein